MGCSSSASAPPTGEMRGTKLSDIKKIKEADISGDNIKMGENMNDNPALFSSAKQLILSSRKALQSSLLSLEGFQLQECPSFFNPVEKPTIFEYEFQQHIGRGAASDVFLVKNVENGMYYAAKIYDQAYLYRTSIGDAVQPIEKVSREIELMVECQHPNILSLIELLDDQPSNSLILIIPYAEKGSLSKSSWKADPLPEPEAKNIFRQIASGLQYLHGLNIIHRDLKPENVLVFDDGHVVISDFSVSERLEDPNVYLEDTEGTPVFYSPEQCSGEPYLGKPADCWAFGIVLYVMIFGKLPFFEADDEAAYKTHFYHIAQVISSSEISYPPSSENLSGDLMDLFHHILDKNPKTRYTIDQIVNHKWFEYDD